MNKLSFNNTVVPSSSKFENEVCIFLSVASSNRPGVYLITFEDYIALDLQQRLDLNGYEYNVNTLKYEYDRHDVEQEFKRMDGDQSKIDERMSELISKIHVTQSPSRCYFAAALTNLFLFAAPFEKRLSGSLGSMVVYLFEEQLINQTVQVSIFDIKLEKYLISLHRTMMVLFTSFFIQMFYAPRLTTNIRWKQQFVLFSNSLYKNQIIPLSSFVKEINIIVKHYSLYVTSELVSSHSRSRIVYIVIFKNTIPMVLFM